MCKRSDVAHDVRNRWGRKGQGIVFVCVVRVDDVPDGRDWVQNDILSADSLMKYICVQIRFG